MAIVASMTIPAVGGATSVHQVWKMPFASAFVEQTIAPQLVSPEDFFAHSMKFQHNPNGDDGLYIGLQQTGATASTRQAHFSIWNTDYAYWVAPSQCESFGGEGTGMKCWIPYAFSTGKSYRVRVRRFINDDAHGSWWQGSVIDPAGRETTIGFIRAPRGTGAVAQSDSFNEYFSATCPTPHSSSFFLAPAALDFYSPIYGTYGGTLSNGPCAPRPRVTRIFGGSLLELGVP